MTDRPADRHTHEATLDDTIDFINTFDYGRDGWTDSFTDATSAVDWLAQRGLVHADACADDADRNLHRIRAVRRALRQISESIVADRPAAPGALAEANRALRSRAILELVPSDEGVALSHRHVGDPIADSLARLVEPLIAEMAAGRPDRLRICDSDTCQWVFFDSSRTGQRRWCDMSTCGNRAKAARHRAKQRNSANAEATEGPVAN